MPFVVDASMALPWFVETAASDQAQRVPQLGEPLYAPDLLLLDVCETAWALVQNAEITAEHARTIAEALSLGIPNIVPSDGLLTAGLELALALPYPLHQCLYLACAQQVEGRLVTLDARLLAAVKGTVADPLVCHLRDVIGE